MYQMGLGSFVIESNIEIAKWSMDWSFTEEKIEKVFKKTYEQLDLGFSKPGLEPREALCSFMLECKALGLLLPKNCSRRYSEYCVFRQSRK